MADRNQSGPGLMTWVLRVVLALAALAAPIITFKAFTDPDTPDPERQQRLREATGRPGASPEGGRGATTDPYGERRP